MAVQLALLPRRVANGLWIRPGTQAIVEVHEAGHGEIKITAGEATAAGWILGVDLNLDLIDSQG